ncbi:MAG: MerR family transcriptional regulator [Acidimicrobiales bacterium]
MSLDGLMNEDGAARQPDRTPLAPAARPGDGFRGPQVCSIVGISYRQLDYWARTDLLRPSISEAKGSGSQRRYSYQDLVELKVIKRLLDAGLSLQSARRALQCLRDGMGEDVSSANLVLGEGSSVLVRSGEEIIDLLKGGQGVLNVLALDGVVSELEAAITSLPVARTGARSPGAEPGLRTGTGR